MLAKKVQQQAGDFPCRTIPNGEFAIDNSFVKEQFIAPVFQNVNNSELMLALHYCEKNISEFLKSEDDRRWRGVTSSLLNSAGESHSLWRLARRVNIDGNAYTLNLHFIPQQSDQQPEEVLSIRMPEGFIALEEGRPHQHPFGDMAVAIFEGAYYMGIATPEKQIADFEWGVVSAGNRYFMSANLQHGTLPLSGHILSLMLHRKVSRNEISENEFSGIGAMDPAKIKVMLNMFRQTVSQDLKLHSFPEFNRLSCD